MSAFPGPRFPAPSRPSPQIFVGCIPCKRVDVRRDVITQCQRCKGPSGQLMIRYRCEQCGWDEWCGGPVACAVDASHSLRAGEVAPLDMNKVKRVR